MQEATPTESESEGSTSEESRPQEPTPNAIEHAVQQHLGLTTSLGCRRVGGGCDHVVWQVGEDYVFRALPRSAEAISMLKQEAAVRNLVSKYQKQENTIPSCMGMVSTEEWVGNLDTRVKGTSLEERHATQKTETDLASFVMAQWSVPVHEAELLLGDEERETVELDDLIPEAHQAWDCLVRCGYVADQGTILSRLLETSSDAWAPKENETNVLLHMDFKGEHILLETSDDDDDGALAGVVDWSDAAVGDVAVDVGGLAISVGQHMAERIAKGAFVSSSAIERGITMARCDTVVNLNERINGDDRDIPEWLLRRQFQRAFEGTLLENALL